MPSFRSGTVTTILEERSGLQRVQVDLGSGPEPAYVLTQLTGDVARGDEVVVNTTAVELGLGTGGWHVVHWNLSRRAWQSKGPGHILKGRYTSLQSDVGSTEELDEQLAQIDTIAGMPVVALALHSQVPAVAVAIRDHAPDARIAYVMTDGAGLPLALSDLVAELKDKGLIDTTVTYGHAFGGDFEAVSVYSALAVAQHVAHADVAIVAMGPGIVGTATRLGFSGMEVAPILDAAAALGGVPIAALRASFADPRTRHLGISHHSQTALGLACRSRVTVALPLVGGDAEATLRRDLEASNIAERHDIVEVPATNILDRFAHHKLTITSMGRPASDDPVLFEAAATAGVVALAHMRNHDRSA
jgi:hypothetical protein